MTEAEQENMQDGGRLGHMSSRNMKIWRGQGRSDKVRACSMVDGFEEVKLPGILSLANCFRTMIIF